jgi:hypothetical protein
MRVEFFCGIAAEFSVSEHEDFFRRLLRERSRLAIETAVGEEGNPLEAASLKNQNH